MKEGKLVESGTHESLKQTGVEYMRLCSIILQEEEKVKGEDIDDGTEATKVEIKPVIQKKKGEPIEVKQGMLGQPNPLDMLKEA